MKTTLIEAEAHSFHIAIGDTREAKAYDVYVGDTHIGVVRNGSRPSYRKHGRIRGSLIGYPSYWAAVPMRSWAGDVRDIEVKSRKAAVEALIAAYEKSKAGAK